MMQKKSVCGVVTMVIVLLAVCLSEAPLSILAASFEDVEDGKYFTEAVDWAAERGITKGTDDTHFSPYEPCTRAQIVTFLYRFAGSPAVKTEGASVFSDVPESAYYYTAVAWAVEKGITKGTDETHFSPGEPCTRAQAVTFLWRLYGQRTQDPVYRLFEDVLSSAFYAKAVSWAKALGITAGKTSRLFGSGDTCTRAEIVTFLWRCAVVAKLVLPDDSGDVELPEIPVTMEPIGPIVIDPRPTIPVPAPITPPLVDM